VIYFGIDIGKFNHQAIAIDEKGNSLCVSFPFSNTDEGFKLFIKSATTFMEKDTICIGMEATGHYWLNLYFALLDLGMELHVVNPIQTDAMRKMSIRKTKTDSVDCKYIAQVIRIGNFSDVVIGDEDVSELRQLCRYRFHLVDTIGAVKNQIIGLLDRIFPEFSSLFSNVFGVTSMEILKKYTTPEQILAVKTSTLVNLLAKASRGRFKDAKAKEIKDAAKLSVGLKSANASFVFQLRQMIMQIDFSESQLKELEQKISEYYNKFECFLSTIDGIGDTLGAAIFSEIGNISRFDNPKKLVAFAGIDPTVRQSGNFIGTHNTMSKRGSVYLRRAIWNAAVVAAQKNPVLSEFYQKKRAEGKDYMTSIGAVSRKLCYIIFAVLRDKKTYIPIA
jgi:transposase